MWYVLITMTTVGYGDVYAKSHAGRSIAVLTAFIGLVLVSLLVVSLMKMLKFNYPQEKAFNLLKRLVMKEELRVYAVGMLTSAYKVKLLRK
jgi:hypothetical protein